MIPKLRLAPVYVQRQCLITFHSQDKLLLGERYRVRMAESHRGVLTPRVDETSRRPPRRALRYRERIRARR